MLQYLIFGGGVAFAAAIQPGPLQAFLLTRVAETGWKRTLPAAFSPLLSDGPIALLVLLVLRNLPPLFAGILQEAGGVLLLWLAFASYRQWKRGPRTQQPADSRTPKTILQAAAINILNPNPYLGWSMVLGPALLNAWKQDPSYGVALIVSFYATLVVTLGATIVLFGTSSFLGPGARRTLILISAIALALLGVYQLLAGIFSSDAFSSVSAFRIM